MDDKQIIENTEAVDTGSTDVQETETNQAEKLFRQEDVDRIIANRLKQVERKFEGIDLEEYNNLKSAAEQAKEQQMMKKEQFEELLHKQKSEADQKLATMQSQLEKVHVDGALLNAAAQHKAVNPEHVANLLKSQVRYNNGTVEVVDSEPICVMTLILQNQLVWIKQYKSLCRKTHTSKQHNQQEVVLVEMQNIQLQEKLN